MIVTPGQLSQRAELYHQLGALIGAGVPILQALEMLRSNPPDNSIRQPLKRIQAGLDRGLTFTAAMQELGHWVPAFDLALLEAGEQSGRLDATFKLLAVYYRERAQMIRGVISDLLYPAFVLHFAIFIFPFIEFFKNSDWQLFLVRTVGVLGLIYLGVFMLIFACQGRRGEPWRSGIEGLLAPVPILGSARRSLALARLAASLEALISAGIPIIGGWDLAAAASGSPALARAVARWKNALQAGQTPAELLTKSHEFPQIFANLYHSGEASGQLDDALKRLHAYYQDEGSRKLRTLAKWFPQLIYLGIVAFVGYKIISFYLDYFGQLNHILQ